MLISRLNINGEKLYSDDIEGNKLSYSHVNNGNVFIMSKLPVISPIHIDTFEASHLITSFELIEIYLDDIEEPQSW